MSDAKRAMPNDAAASPQLPSLTPRWIWITGGGIVSVASLTGAVWASLAAPGNPAIASGACLLGRLLISLLFIPSGIAKVRAPGLTIGYLTSLGLPLAPLGLVIAIGMELIGVPVFLLGYQTRLIAAALFSYCVASAVFFHRDFSDQNQLTHFFKDVAIAGGLLQIVAFGPGGFSLDAL